MLALGYGLCEIAYYRCIVLYRTSAGFVLLLSDGRLPMPQFK